MSTNEKISAAESALQSGESIYASCSQRLQNVQQKKLEIEQQNQKLHDSFIQTQQEEQQARAQIEKCNQGIASIDQAISQLQSKSSSDDDDADNSSVQSQIADLQNSRLLLEQKKQESESILHQCLQRYNAIKSKLLQNKSTLEQCEAEIAHIHSTCQTSISTMSNAMQPLLELTPALGASGKATQKISSFRFGKAVAAQKNAWSQSEMQRSERAANNLSGCISKTEQLIGITTENQTTSVSTSTGDSGGTAASSKGLLGLFGHFFNRNNSVSGGQAQRGSWNGMETAPSPLGNGWTVLPGNHFNKYSEFEANISQHPRTAYAKGEQQVRTVDPADIEGVYLGDSDIENSDNFWSMHNGSQSAWMETASHIPEVRSRLDSGESLDSLLEDEKLGRCAQAYFNPNSSKAIEVDEMAGGGYMFNGDGRHRVIAARAYGHHIPVKVVGIRR